MIVSHISLHSAPLQIRSSGNSQVARRLLLCLHSKGRQSYEGAAINTHTWKHAAESAAHGTIHAPSLTSFNQSTTQLSVHSFLHSCMTITAIVIICSFLKLWIPLALLSHVPSTPVCCLRLSATLQVLLHNKIKYLSAFVFRGVQSYLHAL